MKLIHAVLLSYVVVLLARYTYLGGIPGLEAIAWVIYFVLGSFMLARWFVDWLAKKGFVK